MQGEPKAFVLEPRVQTLQSAAACMKASVVSFGSAASWCQNCRSWAMLSVWKRQRRRSLVWGHRAEMVRARAGNGSVCMAGVLADVLLGTPLGWLVVELWVVG
eukprot:2495433-Ditylum_brightwellii.AAC.2